MQIILDFQERNNFELYNTKSIAIILNLRKHIFLRLYRVYKDTAALRKL